MCTSEAKAADNEADLYNNWNRRATPTRVDEPRVTDGQLRTAIDQLRATLDLHDQTDNFVNQVLCNVEKRAAALEAVLRQGDTDQPTDDEGERVK